MWRPGAADIREQSFTRLKKMLSRRERERGGKGSPSFRCHKNRNKKLSWYQYKTNNMNTHTHTHSRHIHIQAPPATGVPKGKHLHILCLFWHDIRPGDLGMIQFSFFFPRRILWVTHCPTGVARDALLLWDSQVPAPSQWIGFMTEISHPFSPGDAEGILGLDTTGVEVW